MRIPDHNPDSLDLCLLILSSIKYESIGFGHFFLDCNKSVPNKRWSCVFRNPVNFTNPSDAYDTPLEACHGMLDFLRKIQNEKENKSQEKTGYN